MFNNKSGENLNNNIDLEKVARFAAIGAAVVSVALWASRRIPRQATELMQGHNYSPDESHPDESSTEQ